MTYVNQPNGGIHMTTDVKRVDNAYFNSDRFVLLTDSQDTEALREQFPDYTTFLVDASGGDYIEVWGIVGVPCGHKLATRLI